MSSTFLRRIGVVIVPVVLAAAYAVVPAGTSAAPPSQEASPPDAGVVLGHVTTAAAATSATIVIGPGAVLHGYTTKSVTISRGSPLRVVNNDTTPHTVTSVGRTAAGKPLFNTRVEPGRTVSVSGANQLAKGRYSFYCAIHPSMHGTLAVEGSPGGVHASKQRFAQPLVLPKVLTGSHITIPIKRAKVRVLPTGPRTTMWTYAGSYPGPTIRRPAGKDTKITFVNRLPKSAGSVTVHLHGDHHASRHDGQPASHLIRPGKRRTYNYPLTNSGRPERAAFDFYHDHRMDLTSRNNWQGLQGMFIIDGTNSHGLPTGKYDVPLLISDRSFTSSNRLVSPFPKSPTMAMTGPDAPPGDGTVGDRILVDGRYAPYLTVSTHRYRLRLLNGSNFQSYDFALSDHRSFVQVGTGSGLLPKPVRRRDILLGPAQRADVIVDFRGELHRRIVLKSIPRSDHSPSGIGTPAASIMQFRVRTTVRDGSRVPSRLERPPAMRIRRTVSATWTFGLGGNTKTGTYWTINGKPYNPKRTDLRVPLGATRTWLLRNNTSITHYVHIHEEEWRTVRRDGKRPPPWERGLEDTWRLDPGETVRVAARFTDYTGMFMIHCHMLDHEDHGMMAQFAVVKRGARASRSAAATATGGRDEMGGMDMSAMAAAGPSSVVISSSPAGPATTAASAWHRSAARFLTALAVEFAVLGIGVVLLGYRRRFDAFGSR